MEGNKEDAKKCIRIAQKSLSEGDDEKALRFLTKSLKLYPTEEAQGLLRKLQSKSQDSAKPQPNGRSSKSTEGSKSMPDLSELHGSSKPEAKPFTTAQKDLANRINQCKDYYQTLGISKDASDGDIKKAYRKMALQLHPDKNLAPGSTEAFKAVGKAFTILSDPEKRRHYDLYGPDVMHSTARRRRHSSSDYDDDNEGFDPQELFNMFFGGGFPSENVRVFRRGNTYYYDRSSAPRSRDRHQQQHQQGQVAWIQFLPILVILFMTIMGHLLSADPAYSLIKRGEYKYTKHTSSFDVTYYVKSDFDQSYKWGSTARRRLEETVESEYVESLRNICYNERIQKETLRRRGIYLGQKDMVSRAENMRTPSCDKLEEMFRRSP